MASGGWALDEQEVRQLEPEEGEIRAGLGIICIIYMYILHILHYLHNLQILKKAKSGRAFAQRTSFMFANVNVHEKVEILFSFSLMYLWESIEMSGCCNQCTLRSRDALLSNSTRKT